MKVEEIKQFILNMLDRHIYVKDLCKISLEYCLSYDNYEFLFDNSYKFLYAQDFYTYTSNIDPDIKTEIVYNNKYLQMNFDNFGFIWNKIYGIKFTVNLTC